MKKKIGGAANQTKGIKRAHLHAQYVFEYVATCDYLFDCPIQIVQEWSDQVK